MGLASLVQSRAFQRGAHHPGGKAPGLLMLLLPRLLLLVVPRLLLLSLLLLTLGKQSQSPSGPEGLEL